MPYRQIVKIAYAEPRNPPNVLSPFTSLSRTGLESETFESLNDANTLWQVTRVWNTEANALAFKSDSIALRANTAPARTTVLVSGEEID